MDLKQVSDVRQKDRLRQARAIGVKAAHRYGKKPEEIADFFGVSQSTVYNHIGERVFKGVLKQFR